MPGFLPINPRLPLIWHGGDYNPKQWPAATVDEDVRLMQASSFRVATVGVFAWSALQPAEDQFTFEWLDTVFEKLSAAERYAWPNVTAGTRRWSPGTFRTSMAVRATA